MSHGAALDTEGVDLRRRSLLGNFSSPTSGRPPSTPQSGLRQQVPRGRGRRRNPGCWATTPSGNWASATPTAPSNRLLQVRKRSEGPLRCLAARSYGVMVMVDSQGGVFSTGDSPTKLTRIRNIPPMLAVSCGCSRTLALPKTASNQPFQLPISFIHPVGLGCHLITIQITSDTLCNGSDVAGVWNLSELS